MADSKNEDTVIDVTEFEEVEKKRPSFFARNLSEFVLLILVVSMVSALSYPLTVFTVPAGHVGVLFSRFGKGTVTDFVYGEGINIKWPWDKVYTYDTRMQIITEQYDVLTRDGLKLDTEVSIRYHIEKSLAPYLHKYIGKNYRTIILKSEVGSKLRSVLAEYKPQEIYSLNRTKLEDLVEERSRHDVERGKALFTNDYTNDTLEDDIRLIRLDDIRIRSIKLPTRVADAIERKKEQQQIAEEFQYRIQREKLEAQRKRIEAEGIRDFQEIIKKGISPELLQWKGIEASLKLAESKNGKIIMFGSSRDGLPIILGDLGVNKVEGAAKQPAAAPQASDPQASSPHALQPAPGSELQTAE